jgi:leader peptidase (prepilin peptidase)/N-methyltransferase
MTTDLAVSLPFVAVLGAVFGSFLNVVAYRLPRKESIVVGRSHCPACHAQIRAHHNIPVFGWLLLRGRCGSCHGQISPRYPVVEAATAALAVAVILAKTGAHDIVLGLLLAAVVVPIALIDLDHRIIPNRLTGFGAVAAVVAGAALRPAGLPEQLIAGAAAATFLLVFLLAYPGGMGMGDVKLAGMLGLFLGRNVAVAILAGVLLGAIVGAVIIARVGASKGRKTAVPFGPFLALGGAIALFAGPAITHWYLHTIV